MTTFEKIQGKGITKKNKIGKNITGGNWNVERKNGFAAYITGMPTFDKGTIAREVYSVLSRKKKPAEMKEVVREIMKKRPYSNYDSARRTVGRVIGQLVNHEYLFSSRSDSGIGFSFELNKSKKPKNV